MNKSKELRKGLMLVLSSPSGAGKTSICKKVISLDEQISLSVSYTTRPKRKSEKECTHKIVIYMHTSRYI